MKTTGITRACIRLLSACAVGNLILSYAASAENTSASSGSATNSVPVSNFVIPSQPSQGRDPFFPQSTRLNVVTNVAPVVQPSPARLVLQGVSGTEGHRFAIINGQTVTEGETAEVTSNSTRLRFRCLAIREASCVVEIGTERREIFLRAK